MARTSPSPADVGLIEYAASRGVEVSARQLERWRGRPDPLVAPNPRGRPGRPGGSTSTLYPATGELVVWLGRHQARGRRRDDLILQAFAEGLPVPEASVRAAFGRSPLELAADMNKMLGPHAEGEDQEDWLGDGASRIAQAQQHRAVGIPRRMRAIDKALRQMPALAAFWPQMSALDGGNPGEPLDNEGIAFHGALGILQGIDGVAPDTMARILRARSGTADLSLGAWLLEIDGTDAARQLQGTPTHHVPGVPENSMLNHLYSLAMQEPLERLRAAWQAAGTLAPWAHNLCAAAEEEIEVGQPGAASLQWVYGMLFGLTRDLLRLGLAEPKPTPSQQCATALLLLSVATGTDAALELADEDGRGRAALLTPEPVRSLVTGMPVPVSDSARAPCPPIGVS